MTLFFKHLSFLIVMIGIIGIFLISNPANTHAQSYTSNSAIATTHVIIGGTPQSGDIVSFDKRTQTFHLAHVPGDKNAFGIVVKNPILLLSGKGSGVPIITNGEVSVNVTTKNGPIAVGDYISPSSILGKGTRAVISDPYIIGTALSSFSEPASDTTAHTKGIYSGSIQMIFSHRINPLASVGQKIPQNIEIGKNIIFHIIKYILAALVALGTVYVAFKASGSSMKTGITSIGRNPLAKSSINSLLIINIIMIIMISAAGLVAALAIVFLPV